MKILIHLCNFQPLDPWYRFHFNDGTEFDYGPDRNKMLERIHQISPNDVDGYLMMLKRAETIFEIGFEKLSDKPFTKFWDMMAQIPSLIRLKSYFSVSGIVNKYIKHPLLRQAFSIHPLLVGGNPFSTTSIYALIHYLERRWGVFFAMGGTGKLVQALYDLMERAGIDIVLDTDIAQIEVKK